MVLTTYKAKRIETPPLGNADRYSGMDPTPSQWYGPHSLTVVRTPLPHSGTDPTPSQWYGLHPLTVVRTPPPHSGTDPTPSQWYGLHPLTYLEWFGDVSVAALYVL